MKPALLAFVDGKRQVEVIARLGGLVLTASRHGWVISHERSGLLLALWPRPVTLGQAHDVLESLAGLIDWRGTAAQVSPSVHVLSELIMGVIEASGGVRELSSVPVEVAS